MRLFELFNLSEDGLVVPGVNTTADVKPGEIARQAAKMGFSVSPDGIPPEVSKDSVIKSLPSTPAQKVTEKPTFKPFEKAPKGNTEETTETVEEPVAKKAKPVFPPKKPTPKDPEAKERDYSAFHKKPVQEDADPCWDGYEMVGMKKKGKKTVPNCVPKTEAIDEDKDPCWKNFEMVGMKKKGKKTVPNCVPKKK